MEAKALTNRPASCPRSWARDISTRYLHKILQKISTEAFSSDQVNRARLLSCSAGDVQDVGALQHSFNNAGARHGTHLLTLLDLKRLPQLQY